MLVTLLQYCNFLPEYVHKSKQHLADTLNTGHTVCLINLASLMCTCL